MEKDDRYNPSTRWAGKTSTEQDNEQLEESLFFTILRQPNASARFISFHLNGGGQHTLAAREISESYYHPSVGIILFFGMGKIHIQGRNLESLYRYLKENRVKEIREFSDSSQVFFTSDALFINKIDYESQNMLRLAIDV